MDETYFTLRLIFRYGVRILCYTAVIFMAYYFVKAIWDCYTHPKKRKL
jgi:hypothetical protein